jgi:hypothetical protein
MVTFSADPPKPPKPKMLSRVDRWKEAVSKALEGLEQLLELQDEYSEWYDSLPENMQGSTVAEKLEEVANLDIECAIDLVNEADAMDLPKGFGRD